MTSTPIKVNKKPWTVDEDEKLLRFLERGSKAKWSKIASKLDINRTGKQCRERFKNHLSPKIKKGDWTPEEDKIIIAMKKVVGNHWTQIANLLPGRSDNAVKNRFRSIEKNPAKGRRSCFRIKPQIIDTPDDKELIERFGYSHDEHEHCNYDWQNNYHSVSRMVTPMDLHQHCDHEVEQTSKNDFSVDCKENNSSADIDKAEANIGWFEDSWVDDIIQIAQLDIPNEVQAFDATNMVTPISRNPITSTFTVDNLLQSMFSRINVSYPTLDINNAFIGSNKPIPRFRTVSLQ